MKFLKCIFFKNLLKCELWECFNKWDTKYLIERSVWNVLWGFLSLYNRSPHKNTCLDKNLVTEISLLDSPKLEPKEAEIGMVLIYWISCWSFKSSWIKMFGYVHRLSVLFKLHNIWQDYWTRILTLWSILKNHQEFLCRKQCKCMQNMWCV